MKSVVEDDITRIAKNLKTLREYKHDTREKLACKLEGYSRHTIDAYELRKRNIPQEYITAVAKVYNFPVNMIVEQTLTKELLVSYDSLIDRSDFLKCLDLLFFATATSERAKSNEHFKKAEEYRERIESLDFMEMMPNSARTLYYKSFIEDGILAGAANTLMMIFVEYAQINVFPDVFSKNLADDLTNGELYNLFKRLVDGLTPAKKKFLQTTQKIFDECLFALGSVNEGRIHAEYYTALKYLLCMIDNEREYRENLEIGIIMMKEFSKIGNPLAKKVVDIFELT